MRHSPRPGNDHSLLYSFVWQFVSMEVVYHEYNLAQHKNIYLWDVQRSKRMIEVTREWRKRQRDS